MECRGVFMLQAQACVFLLLRSGEADGGSTCSSINAQQGDGSNLVAQGVEALDVAALGGELQDILSALVSVLGQGQHNAVAVSQAVSSQVLALVLRAGNVQVQVGDVLAGGVVDSVLGGLDLGLAGSCLRACSLRGSGSGRSNGRSSGRSGGGRSRTAASGHTNSQCQSSGNNSNILEFHCVISPCL